MTIALFSMLGLFAKVFIVDDILDSINMCKAFTIITSEAEAIDDYIMNELNHGATLHYAKGAYTGEEKQIITKTSEMMGKGFRDNLN